MTLHPDWLEAGFTMNGITGCMTTRAGGDSQSPFDSMNLRHGVDDPRAVDANRTRFSSAIGASPVFLDQIHGNRVVRVGHADAVDGAPVHSADACVTTEPGVACTVLVADCLPVLFAARNGRAVGAAHAGWRGLAAGVLEATVETVSRLADCGPEDIDTWLGACIGPEHFEVGPDVLAAFDGSIDAVPSALADDARRASPIDQPLRFVPYREGKWLANLPMLARDRLQATGITRIGGDGLCTVSDASRFYSFRRDRVTGRMAAAVWIESRAATV